MLELSKELKILPGTTAVIGSGGKTTLIKHLAKELSKVGTVLIMTTTHIFPCEEFPLATTEEELSVALHSKKIVCVGKPVKDGKLETPDFSVEGKAEYILVEADGAKHYPLKAHNEYEPVIPKEANQVIQVVGSHGFHHPIRDVCHRAEKYACLLNIAITDSVTPQMAARVINLEGLCHRVFVNERQALTVADRSEFLNTIQYPTVIAGLVTETELH